MLYILLTLVVALAVVCGAEYATLRVVKAEHEAEVAKHKEANRILGDKLEYLANENRELCNRMEKMNRIKEGLN